MMIFKKYQLNPAANLLLLAIFIFGIIYNAWALFLNLFVLALGFDREFLGLANMMPAAAALILGIPLGVLSDRVGQKKALLVGLTAAAAACGLMAAADNARVIMAAAFLWGAGITLFTISLAPFMMEISDENNRLTLFSLNGSLQVMSGIFGNYLAGLIPGVAADWFNLSEISPGAYQSVFLCCAVVGLLGIIPIHFIHKPEHTFNPSLVQSVKTVSDNPVENGMRWLFNKDGIKLLAPNFIIGAGAGILIPYLNVFYMEKFGLGNESLGFLFSLSSLITGVGMLAGPQLARWCGGKIRLVVLVQALSLGFMLLSGFSQHLIVSSIGFLIRAMLINIAPPVWSAFVMEQTAPGRQGTMSSFQNLLWTAGWFCGPYISGLVQARYGFSPLFISTSIIYAVAIILTWVFFRNSEKKVYSGVEDINAGYLTLAIDERE
ncbi:MAG: MFS transporter [Anaerolineaceae bacterium]